MHSPLFAVFKDLWYIHLDAAFVDEGHGQDITGCGMCASDASNTPL